MAYHVSQCCSPLPPRFFFVEVWTYYDVLTTALHGFIVCVDRFRVNTTKPCRFRRFLFFFTTIFSHGSHGSLPWLAWLAGSHCILPRVYMVHDKKQFNSPLCSFRKRKIEPWKNTLNCVSCYLCSRKNFLPSGEKLYMTSRLRKFMNRQICVSRRLTRFLEQPCLCSN